MSTAGKGGAAQSNGTRKFVAWFLANKPFAALDGSGYYGHDRGSLIRTTIEEQLRFEPKTAAHNREPRERPSDMGAR